MMKLKHQKLSQYVDPSTGELVEVTTEKTYNIKVPGDKFYMTFIESIAPLYKLKSLTDLKLLIKFCELAEFDTGKVVISPALRKDICKELLISTNSFSISIKSLTEKGLIEGDRGSYKINPLLHWKGSQSTREKLIRSVDFTFKINMD